MLSLSWRKKYELMGKSYWISTTGRPVCHVNTFGCYFLVAVLQSISACFAAEAAASDIEPKPVALKGAWGDQGDGTFVNPIIPGDYSDIDAIRVGDDYYAISSTFQFSPGVVILHSKDLVNWTILGHAVNDITQIAPEMNWDRMARYGRGIWAGSIRHHNDRFWIYFGTPNEGFFVTTANEAAGPWSPIEQVWNVKGWDDCCPFWDDDGQGYFVCSNFSDGYKIHLFKLTADGKHLIADSDKVIHQSKGSEANKFYKIDGRYYHYYSEVRGEGRVAMMERSKSLDGPWESKQLNHVSKRINKEPNQGGLIQLSSGDWWFLTHQGVGDWEGRAMVLLPVTRVDGWPIIGKVGEDGIGSMVWTAKKPIEGLPTICPQSDDEFDGPLLAPQWEWNYQPRSEKWSLTERPGFFRLHGFKPLKPNDLLTAGNTLTQRAMRTNRNEVEVKFDLSGMADGQEAGLCHFAKGYSTIGVLQAGNARNLTFNENGKVTVGPALTTNNLWLKSTWEFDGNSQYSYSIDGKTFTPFGNRWQLTWGNYRGDRIGIFSYNNKADNGSIDVDWFHYAFDKPPGH
jgi:beta-xylosidase